MVGHVVDCAWPWQRHQCKEQEQEESLGAPPHGEDVTFGVYHAFDERRLWGSNPRPWD